MLGPLPYYMITFQIHSLILKMVVRLYYHSITLTFSEGTCAPIQMHRKEKPDPPHKSLMR